MHAWAIHFGWNTIFLNSAYVLGGQSLNEPQMFNLVLGHRMTAAVVLTGAAVTTFVLRRVLLERPGAQLQPGVRPQAKHSRGVLKVRTPSESVYPTVASGATSIQTGCPSIRMIHSVSSNDPRHP